MMREIGEVNLEQVAEKDSRENYETQQERWSFHPMEEREKFPFDPHYY